jgi:hypothetical protein
MVQVQASPVPPAYFLPKYPGETRNQTFDFSTLNIPALTFANLQSLTAAAAPSGTGELVLVALSVTGSVLTLDLTGGQPTRTYTVLFTATLRDGETLQWLVRQNVNAVLPTDAAADPPSWGFGSAVTWSPPP